MAANLFLLVLVLGVLWWLWRATRPIEMPDFETMKAQLDKLPPAERDFSADQRKALTGLAKGLGHKRGIRYQLLGTESLAGTSSTEAGAAMLQALAEEDWEAVRAHAAFPIGDVLRAVALAFDDGTHHWVLLNWPEDLYASASIVTHNPIKTPPDGEWQTLVA